MLAGPTATIIGRFHMPAQSDEVFGPAFLLLKAQNEALECFQLICIVCSSFCPCSANLTEFSLLCQACTEKGAIIVAA
jgi:hypothetical protein